MTRANMLSCCVPTLVSSYRALVWTIFLQYFLVVRTFKVFVVFFSERWSIKFCRRWIYDECGFKGLKQSESCVGPRWMLGDAAETVLRCGNFLELTEQVNSSKKCSNAK